MPSTLNQVSSLPFENNLFLNGLNKDDKYSLVADFSNGYNTLTWLVNMNAPARQVDGSDGVFFRPIMGTSKIQGFIAATALLSPTIARITLNDPTYAAFREKTTVADGSAAMNKGYVVNQGAGFVDIQCVAPILAWNLATQFLAGASITEMWSSAGNRGSTGPKSSYEYPQYVQNQTSVMREKVEMYRRDMSKTWVEFKGDYWYSSQDVIAANRFSRAEEYHALFSELGQINTSLEGAVSYSMGLRAAVKDPDRGGEYVASANLLTENDFINWISRIADRRTSIDTRLPIFLGREALKRIQFFQTINQSIRFAGTRNTFGGETVKGLDVREYDIAGIACDLILAPIFNDKDRFPDASTIAGAQGTRMQHTMVCLDLSYYQTVDGSGEVPAMENCYFGANEIEYGYMSGIGMSMQKGGDVYQLMTSPRDNAEFHILKDGCYDFLANRMGWWELAL